MKSSTPPMRGHSTCMHAAPAIHIGWCQHKAPLGCCVSDYFWGRPSLPSCKPEHIKRALARALLYLNGARHARLALPPRGVRHRVPDLARRVAVAAHGLQRVLHAALEPAQGTPSACGWSHSLSVAQFPHQAHASVCSLATDCSCHMKKSTLQE